MTGIVLCNDSLTGSCEHCGMLVGHKPLCLINLRMLQSMAGNIERDQAKLARRTERLAELLGEVHEHVLRENTPKRTCPSCGKERPPTGGGFCGTYCESNYERKEARKRGVL